MNKILWKSIREETKLITNYTENNYLVLIGKIISDRHLVTRFMEKAFMYLT